MPIPEKYVHTLWTLLYPGGLRYLSDGYFWLYGHILKFCHKIWVKKPLFRGLFEAFLTKHLKKTEVENEKKVVWRLKKILTPSLNTYLSLQKIIDTPHQYFFPCGQLSNFCHKIWLRTPFCPYFLGAFCDDFLAFFSISSKKMSWQMKNISSQDPTKYVHTLWTLLYPGGI